MCSETPRSRTKGVRSIVTQLRDALTNVVDRAMSARLPRSGVKHMRVPTLHKLLDRAHVDQTVVQIRVEPRHVAAQEAAVLIDRVACERSGAFRTMRAHEFQDLLLGFRFGDGRCPDATE